MGNFFDQTPSSPIDELLISYLKTKNLKDVEDTLDYVAENYPFTTTLSIEEFTDVFTEILDDRSDQVFMQLANQSLEGKVDLYESLSSIIIFCGEEFPTKLRFVFEMFDFDKSGEIEKKELIMTFQANIRALCKMVNIDPPSLKEIDAFASQLFEKVDSDGSGAVSFNEFQRWMKHSFQLQDFLLKYAQTQTYENADRRTLEFHRQYESIFTEVAVGDWADPQAISQALMQRFDYLDPSLMHFLSEALVATSKRYVTDEQHASKVYRDSYMNVMKCWAAFDATDINHDNQTSLLELKFLLYAFEGDIPDAYRVGVEMKALDQDLSGYVSRQEWITYICVDEKNFVKSSMRSNLKTLFIQYDADQSGFLSRAEIETLLGSTLQVHSQRFHNDSDPETIQKLVLELMAEVGDETSWPDFKLFMERQYSQCTSLRQFLQLD